MAMQDALKMAGLQPAEIDYINLHGTPPKAMMRRRAKPLPAVFGPSTPCSSTKGATGHTLGAAGGVEAVICALALQHGLLPAGINTQQLDSTMELDYVLDNREQPLARVLSNSFGFGGTNCSLIFGRATPYETHRLHRRHRLARPWFERLAQQSGYPWRRQPYQSHKTILPTPALLPAAERRRSGAIVKLTLATGWRPSPPPA